MAPQPLSQTLWILVLYRVPGTVQNVHEMCGLFEGFCGGRGRGIETDFLEQLSLVAGLAPELK